MTVVNVIEAGPGSAVDFLSAFGARVDPAARCNAAAVAAGRMELTYPQPEALGAYLADFEHHLLVAETPGRMFGYAVVRDGGRIRWLVLDDTISADEALAAVRAIAEECVARWGACFGRVGNDVLRDLIRRLPEVGVRPDDPEVLVWQ